MQIYLLSYGMTFLSLVHSFCQGLILFGTAHFGSYESDSVNELVSAHFAFGVSIQVVVEFLEVFDGDSQLKTLKTFKHNFLVNVSVSVSIKNIEHLSERNLIDLSNLGNLMAASSYDRIYKTFLQEGSIDFPFSHILYKVPIRSIKAFDRRPEILDNFKSFVFRDFPSSFFEDLLTTFRVHELERHELESVEDDCF